MKLKSLLQGTLFTAALGLCLATGVMTAQAAAGDGEWADAGISKVAVDGTTQTMTITLGSAKEARVSVGKISKTGVVTPTTWDVYDGTNLTVDLSKLNNTKDNYLIISSNAKKTADGNEGVSIVKIPAATKYTKAAVTVDGKLQVASDNENKKPTVADLTADTAKLYEYRTALGKWADTTATLDLSMYQNQGATLYVRTKGGTSTSDLTQEATSSVKYGTKGSETSLKAYNGLALPGKEVKVNVPARAKGPSVKVDYTKGTVTLPKNTEYRMLTTDFKYEKDTTCWKSDTTKATPVTAETLFTDSKDTSAKTMTLEVRTVADKKAASKWTLVDVAKPEALTVATPGNTTLSADDKSKKKTNEVVTGKGIKDAVLKEKDSDTSSVLEVNYVDPTAKKPEPKTFTIKNNGQKTYEVVTTASTLTAPANTEKVYKIAPGKTVTIKNVDNGSNVFVRVAGSKATKTAAAVWVGGYSKLGVVDYSVFGTAAAE